MIRLLLATMLLASTLLQAQSPGENSNGVFDRTVQYVKQVSTYCTDWANEPSHVVNRKFLSDALAQVDKVEHDIASVLIKMESDQKKEIGGKEIVRQLKKLSDLASQLLLNFKDDKSLDDPVTVMLCQDMAETEITPLANDLIAKLSHLKNNQ